MDRRDKRHPVYAWFVRKASTRDPQALRRSMSDRFAKFAAAAPDGESSGEEAKAAPSSPSRSAFANIRSRFEKKDGPVKGAAVNRASGNNAFASIRARFEKTPVKTTDSDDGGGVAGAQQEAPKKARGHTQGQQDAQVNLSGIWSLWQRQRQRKRQGRRQRRRQGPKPAQYAVNNVT